MKTVHPHVRGEDVDVVGQTPDRDGSPPRAWGRRGNSNAANQATRFTPTCVGKTTNGLRSSWRIAVHPHVRGEDVKFFAAAPGGTGSLPRAWGRCSFHASFVMTTPGSPPRAWGRCARGRPGDVNARFTPTCVGKMPGTGTRHRRD